MLIPRGPQGMLLRSYPQSHLHQALPLWGQLPTNPGPPEQRESGSSAGPDRVCCAETRPRKGVQRRVREEKVETRPRPQEGDCERRASFPRKKGQMRNALGVRATPAREPQ